MNAEDRHGRPRTTRRSRTTRSYDRGYLLSPAKRNQVMELWEIRRYGRDSFGDADYVHIYGMPPAAWYRQGVRLLARTAVECVRDALGDLIGAEVARFVHGAPVVSGMTVIDPFAGSCNSLYWILRHLQDANGVACEVDDAIFAVTSRNRAVLDVPIELVHGDYSAHLPGCRLPADRFIVVFVAPPWGDALQQLTGLDLRRTQPPVCDVVDICERMFGSHAVLYVTQVHQHIEPASLAELERRFDWSELHIYDINVEGMKHGVLLGTQRWMPH